MGHGVPSKRSGRGSGTKNTAAWAERCKAQRQRRRVWHCCDSPSPNPTCAVMQLQMRSLFFKYIQNGVSVVKKIIQIVVIGASLLIVNPAVQAFDAGVSVYNSKCIICHGSGAFGAPKLGDKKAWAPRIATGMNAMLANVIKGKKDVMPPMGTCAPSAPSRTWSPPSSSWSRGASSKRGDGAASTCNPDYWQRNHAEKTRKTLKSPTYIPCVSVAKDALMQMTCRK